jgi:hypothetical protein
MHLDWFQEVPVEGDFAFLLPCTFIGITLWWSAGGLRVSFSPQMFQNISHVSLTKYITSSDK